MAKAKGPVKKALTKSEIYREVAEATGVARKDVAAVFDELGGNVERHLKLSPTV